jgi:hypothetical protein
VRRRPDILEGDQRVVIGHGLALEHVKPGTSEAPFLKGFREGELVDDRPTRDVDHQCAWFHQSEPPWIKQVVRFRLKPARDDDNV